MAVPTFQELMLPLLRIYSDGKQRSLKECITDITQLFELNEEDQNELLPSGRQTRLLNCISWAAIYMHEAGLLSRPQRGVYRITDRGREVLTSNPEKIDVIFLKQFDEFLEFKQRKRVVRSQNQLLLDQTEKTPEEMLETAYQELKENLANEVLQAVKQASPKFFERLVIDLLLRMGYGGSRREAGQAVGRSGDGGIDGIINEDRLGLDIIYIQAKRWEEAVGRPEIQKFVGALSGKHSQKGIFITTSTYSQDALDYVQKIDKKIILIDGFRLAEYMIEHNVGLNTVTTYEIKRIDSDYFSEE